MEQDTFNVIRLTLGYTPRLNGHVGSAARGFKSVHGDFGLGEVNMEGKSILEFSSALDLTIANTWLMKRYEHFITYKKFGDIFLSRLLSY